MHWTDERYRSGKVPVSEDDERDPYGETRPVADPEADPQPDILDPFDAFRARRALERAQQEPFPPGYGGEPAPRRRLRSAILFGGVLALVVGVGAAVWAATGPSTGSPAPAAAGTPAASAPAAPGSKAAKGARGSKGRKAVTARLTVTSVGPDSFTATDSSGATLVVHLTPATRFGTPARPFTRSQLVPDAVVLARLRTESDGTVVAAVIAGPAATPPGGSSSAP